MLKPVYLRSFEREIEKAKKRVPLEHLLQVMLTLPPVRNFRESLFRPGQAGMRQGGRWSRMVLRGCHLRAG